jgi:hypothetical protein
VIFDVESTGPYEVDILSISIAGMLSRVVKEDFVTTRKRIFDIEALSE